MIAGLVEDDLPGYSEGGLSARDIFLFEFNQILFYVEDEGQENLYFMILGKMFSNIRIDNIFPLGGKANVIRHHRESRVLAGRLAVYIVDKDFDDYFGLIASSNLIYLNRYSIENYLFEEEAVVNLIVEEKPACKITEVSANIKFAQFMEKTLLAMQPLVRTFFLAQCFESEQKNTKHSIRRFAKGPRSFELDDEKISTFEMEIFSELSAAGHFSSIEEMRELGDLLFPRQLYDMERSVCGKHILGLLQYWLTHCWDVDGISAESMTYRLAKLAKMESLDFIRARVNALLSDVGAGQAIN